MRTDRLVRRGSLRRRRGGAVLELAVCGLLLCMILYGAIEGGQYFYVKSVMTDAARDGCRNGILAYQAGTGSGVNGPQGSYASVMGVVANELIAAQLVPTGTSYTTTSPFTVGNFTVTFFDCSGSTYATHTAMTTAAMNTMTVGDGLMVTISCNWSIEGGPFHESALNLLNGPLAQNGHLLTTSCVMCKEAQ